MHHPVLSGPRSFRLLTIVPGHQEDAMATRLFTAELPAVSGGLPRYDALSYVWGTQADKLQISCNGRIVDVTQNLHSALVQLRSEHDEHVIWVDQLCINQDDAEERSREVAIMGQIYGLAQEVIVWLGPSDSDTLEIFDLFHKLGRLRDFEASELYCLARGDQRRHKDRAIKPTKDDGTRTRIPPRFPPGSASIWRAVERFLDRPWFCRVWTYQEIVLSKASTVYCGPCKISWSDLLDACVAIIYAGADKYIGQKQHRVTTVGTQRDRLRNGGRTALRALLEISRDRDATEPRDHVYALRGMFDEVIARSVHVDYLASLGEVYAKAAKISIKQDGNLAILGSVKYGRTQENQLEMPSWVPDWRYKTFTLVDLSMRRIDGSTFFNASKGERPYSILYPEPEKLGLRGFIVAKLTRFSEVRRWLDFGTYAMGQQRFPNARFQASQWKEMYSSAAGDIGFPFASLQDCEHSDRITASLWGKSIDDPLDEHQAIEMAYRRTVSADLLPRPTSSRLDEVETEMGFPAYTSWQTAGFPDPIPTDVLREHDTYVTEVMNDREFFIAEGQGTSYMGIVMGVPREGDHVCILLGGDTPFILRSRENSDEWQFIGEAYVHGIMDGQAMARTHGPGFEFQAFAIT
ncbi:MAG: hypothetical protein Q9195_007385 [Heterodermia aff. obscurata]